MPLREAGSDDQTEPYPHQGFLDDDSEAERAKRSHFISERFVLPRLRKNWDERDDAIPPSEAELEGMRTMTLERIVDRALAKAVWVRAAITNMYELRAAARRNVEQYPDEDEKQRERGKRSDRRVQRKIEYWTAERDAVDHALSAMIETRRQVLAVTRSRRRRSRQPRP